MKLPRDVGAKELIKVLEKLGYKITRQKGSHIRLTVKSSDGENHITIPNHNPVKIGTLAAIVSEVQKQLDISREEILSNF